jgi:hypothetical protein
MRHLSGLMLPILVLVLIGHSENPSGLKIEALMSAADFRDAGLTKLSAAELGHLNSWLNTFTSRIGEAKSSSNTPDVIESEIDGEFHGWAGDTIFKLTNGQIWQQTEYDYDYEYAYRPEVTIFNTSGGFKMKVEDMEDSIYVKRIK